MDIQSFPDGVQFDPQEMKKIIEGSRELLLEAQEAKSNGNTELAVVKATEALSVINNVAQALTRPDPQLAATVAVAALGRRAVTISETETHNNQSRRTKGIGFFLFAENSTSYNTVTLTRKVEID